MCHTIYSFKGMHIFCLYNILLMVYPRKTSMDQTKCFHCMQLDKCIDPDQIMKLNFFFQMTPLDIQMASSRGNLGFIYIKEEQKTAL